MTEVVKNNNKLYIIIRAVGTILLALITAMVFRSLAFEPFRIPSGSMKSTLLVGDYIFVAKYYYGYSHYSFPFALPLFKNRIVEFHKPEAGDVVVFKLPKNDKIHYIKRIIGLPGDAVQIKRGKVIINGKVMKYGSISPFIDTNDIGIKKIVNQFTETLYNGRSYTILQDSFQDSGDNTPIYKVPQGHVFVLGDNRDNSQDSRFMNEVGYIPIDHIIGKAVIVALSFNNTSVSNESILDKLLPLKIRKDRIWHTIK